MKPLKSKLALLTTGIIFGLSSLNSNAQIIEKEKYWKLGFNARTFNNSNLNNYVGELVSIESAFGQKIAPNLRGELYLVGSQKSIEKEKISDYEMAALFDYIPGDFYVGIGPKISFLNSKFEGEDNSITSYGLCGRIGYELPISSKARLYGEYNYSQLNYEQDGETYDLGKSGVSIGIKF